jgi:hypothetical protein
VIPAKACYVAAMPTWVIIAALATIGITALLTGVLYRINAPPGGHERRRDDAGDGGGSGSSDGDGSSD